MRRTGEDGRVSATVGREGADDDEGASTSGLNPELTAGLVAEVRRGAPARSRGTRWGKVGEGSGRWALFFILVCFYFSLLTHSNLIVTLYF